MTIKYAEENRRSAKKDIKAAKCNSNRMRGKQKGEKAVINSKQYVSVQVNEGNMLQTNLKLCDVFTAVRVY